MLAVGKLNSCKSWIEQETNDLAVYINSQIQDVRWKNFKLCYGDLRLQKIIHTEARFHYKFIKIFGGGEGFQEKGTASSPKFNSGDAARIEKLSLLFHQNFHLPQ